MAADDEFIEDLMQALANDDADGKSPTPMTSPTPVYSSQKDMAASQESVQAVDTADASKPSLLQLLRAAAHGSAAGLSMTSEMHLPLPQSTSAVLSCHPL